jgi:hypothetical protein
VSVRKFVAQLPDTVLGDPAERFFRYLRVVKGNSDHPLFHVYGFDAVHFSDKPAQGKGTFRAKMFFHAKGNLFHEFFLPTAAVVMMPLKTVPDFLQYITKKPAGKIIFPSLSRGNI